MLSGLRSEQDSPVALYRRVAQGVQKCKSAKECIDLVEVENWALINNRLMLEIDSLERCLEEKQRTTYVAKGVYFPTGAGFIVPHGSSLKPPFDKFIDRSLHAGLTHHWMASHWPDAARCDSYETHEREHGFKFEDLYHIFILSGILWSLSLLVLIMECAMKIASYRYSSRQPGTFTRYHANRVIRFISTRTE